MDNMKVHKKWSWRGYSFEIRVSHTRYVGLVDGEVICDLGDSTSQKCAGELYDYGKYLSTRDHDQSGYNCPVCEKNYSDRSEWEKHLHLNHIEDFSRPLFFSLIDEPDVKHYSDLDESDSLEEIEDFVVKWREYWCKDDSNCGFSGRNLGSHLIRHHPDEVFF